MGPLVPSATVRRYQNVAGIAWANAATVLGGVSVTATRLVRCLPLEAPLSTSELLDEQPERRRLTVVFVCDPLREFFGTTAYSLGVAVALPMLKGLPLRDCEGVRRISPRRAGRLQGVYEGGAHQDRANPALAEERTAHQNELRAYVALRRWNPLRARLQREVCGVPSALPSALSD